MPAIRILKVKDLELDTESCMLYRGEEKIELSSVEYRIMHLFMEEQSVGETAFLLVPFLTYSIMKGLEGMLPAPASGLFTYLSTNVWGNSDVFQKIPGPQQILVVFVLLILLCIYLLPYIAGVIYYSSIVVKKMEEVRDYSGPAAHLGRSLAQLDRASAHLIQSAFRHMPIADQPIY